MKKLVSCGARGADSHWEAICFDLDIMVEGSSLQDAKARLKKAISIYVEQALKEEEPARSQLLNRKAPLSVRISWNCSFLIWSIVGIFRNRNESPVEFDAPCPV